MIKLAPAGWNDEQASLHVLRRLDGSVSVTLPLIMDVANVLVLSESLEKFANFAKAVALCLDPEPGPHEALIDPVRGTNPVAYLSFSTKRGEILITPPILVSLDEARRIHKQLGLIISAASESQLRLVQPHTTEPKISGELG